MQGIQKGMWSSTYFNLPAGDPISAEDVGTGASACSPHTLDGCGSRVLADVDGALALCLQENDQARLEMSSMP